ncbi:MAG: ABC transporter substrate-binding protein [Deltaproteobacteria bacterium]|jgi:phospholipid transport system substrate-binding protein|nr:ABC transporter substrate-binding protein [Deltaproteobacteria bacterium]
MIKRYGWIWLVVVLLLSFGQSVLAAEPADVLKAPMDEALALLRDPQYKVDDPEKKAVQREKFWSLVAPVFDFDELSKRTLARNWANFNDAQQAEFAQVFSELLGNIYVDRIQGGYSDETIEFGDQILHDARPLAVVKTFIVSARNRIPVDYSLIQKGDTWRVYDVKVEGVSLVKNYRSQFKEILSKESPDELIERLKQKVAEQKEKLTQG